MKVVDRPLAEPPPWRDLARRALLHNVAGRADIARRCVARIAHRFGDDQIPQVLLAWVDTTVIVAGDRLPDPDRVREMLFFDVDTGVVQGVDEVPPPVRFAGRFLLARLMDDQVMGEALIRAVGSDGEWARNVSAVLNMCAELIKQCGVEVAR